MHPISNFYAHLILNLSATFIVFTSRYPIETFVSEPDRSSLIEALTYHPRGGEKIGIGVKAIKVNYLF
jgi:Protein of unknown function (DUF3223)